MRTAGEKLRDKLRKLHAQLGSDNRHERDAAWNKINELLAREKKSWNDLPAILSGGDSPQGESSQQQDISNEDSNTASNIGPLDLIQHILRRHLHLTDHEFVAVSL